MLIIESWFENIPAVTKVFAAQSAFCVRLSDNPKWRHLHVSAHWISLYIISTSLVIIDFSKIRASAAGICHRHWQCGLFYHADKSYIHLIVYDFIS